MEKPETALFDTVEVGSASDGWPVPGVAVGSRIEAGAAEPIESTRIRIPPAPLR